MLSSLRVAIARVRSLFSRRAQDDDFTRELDSHLAMLTDENIRRGMAPGEARRLARLRLGGSAQLEETNRELRGLPLLESLAQDIRFALRMLRKSPVFTAVAILTLALGIGANTAIFSITYGILLKPLPFPDPSRILQIWADHHGPEPYRTPYASRREFDAIQQQSHAFEQIAFYDESGFTITGDGPPESVQASVISSDFLTLLGAQPLVGRPILPSDAEPGHNQVAMISHALWQRRFGGDPQIVGRTVFLQISSAGALDDRVNPVRPYKIVGVLPSRFPFPNLGEILAPPPDGLIATQMITVARLKDGLTLDRANLELHTIAGRLASAYPEKEKNTDLAAGTLRDRLTTDYRTRLLILLGAASFVLLLACSNVSSLLIARSWVRQREVAIRGTLGASRWRLVRQFLSESVLLGHLSGSLGLLFAHWGVRLLLSAAPAGIPRLDEIAMDRWVFVYALGISCFGGTLFGLAPALQITESGPGSALKEGGGSFTGTVTRRKQTLQQFLVVGEIALAFVLVVGSTLMIRSFSILSSVPVGYSLDHVLTVWVSFSHSNSADLKNRKAMVDAVLQGTRSIHGVKSAAFGAWMPMTTIFDSLVLVEGRSETDRAQLQLASPGYFETLGIPLLSGREFSGVDRDESPFVAVVNESMAKEYFDGSPLGKRISWRKDKTGQRIWVEVVGVVSDTRDQGPSREPNPAFYIPIFQSEFLPETALLVRTTANPLAVSQAVTQEIWSVDKDAPISEIETMDQRMSDQVAEPRFQTQLLSAFGGLALLLAVVGIYGVISYNVVQRTHEIGVRVAMGARPRDVARLMIGEAGILTAVGLAVGVAAAFGLTRFLQSLLFEIKPTDPATFLGVALLIAGVALAACYIPARRALRVDPLVALRHE
jgi:putative ABC transport system permease protein